MERPLAPVQPQARRSPHADHLETISRRHAARRQVHALYRPPYRPENPPPSTHEHLRRRDHEGIKSLMPLKNLQRLALSKRVTDQTMAVIGQMSSLEGLYLAGSRLTNAGLAHLAQIPSLRYLLLKNEKLTDSTMASPISRSSATSRSWTSATQRPP